MIQRLTKTPVLFECVVLSLLCMVDTFWTVLMVEQGRAREANPVMAFFLAQGVLVFVASKVLSFVPAVVAVEVLRQSNAKFAIWAIRLGTVGYITLYALGEFKINHLI